MGHRQKINDKQRLDWDVMQYKARQQARRGHNYPYWNESKHNNWDIFNTTTSEDEVIKWKKELLISYPKVKIVCGYKQTVQRIKHFTVIYKETLIRIIWIKAIELGFQFNETDSAEMADTVRKYFSQS